MLLRRWNTLQPSSVPRHLWGLTLGVPGEGSLAKGLWDGAGRVKKQRGAEDAL